MSPSLLFFLAGVGTGIVLTVVVLCIIFAIAGKVVTWTGSDDD